MVNFIEPVVIQRLGCIDLFQVMSMLLLMVREIMFVRARVMAKVFIVMEKGEMASIRETNFKEVSGLLGD